MNNLGTVNKVNDKILLQNFKFSNKTFIFSLSFNFVLFKVSLNHEIV